MGRYEEGESKGLFGFCNIIMCECFHCIGNFVVRNTALYRVVRNTTALRGISWSTVAVIRSWPGAFFLDKCLICSWISRGVNGGGGGDNCRGTSRKSET